MMIKKIDGTFRMLDRERMVTLNPSNLRLKIQYKQCKNLEEKKDKFMGVLESARDIFSGLELNCDYELMTIAEIASNDNNAIYDATFRCTKGHVFLSEERIRQLIEDKRIDIRKIESYILLQEENFKWD